MDKCYLVLLVAITMAMSLPALAETQEEPIGSITNIKGTVRVLRGENEVVAEKGARLYASDAIRTGEGGGVGVVLRDDTTLSLGPLSELKMSEFKFEPNEGVLGMTLNVAKGTLVYISGQIAKLAPGSAQVETPAGVAAVRGTKLLVEVGAPEAAKRKEKREDMPVGGGGGSSIGLDAPSSTGSGSGATFGHIPASLIWGGNYVYPGSPFGEHFANSDFEERSSLPGTPVPEPPAWVILILGLGGLVFKRTRKALWAGCGPKSRWQ